MKTVTLQIGNSDNKLTQQEWSSFVSEIQQQIDKYAETVFFFGGSPNWSPWQNVSWVFIVDPTYAVEIIFEIKGIRERYRQDSAAWTEGSTLFI